MLILLDRNDTARVITSRLKDLEALNANRTGLRLVAKITNDATTFVIAMLLINKGLVYEKATEKLK